MALSPVQQGVIVQSEFAKLVIVGSDGQVELNPALTDDDRRDFEAHIRRRFGLALAIQCKSSLRLWRNGRLLKVAFSVREDQLVSNDLFYYFFAHLDLKQLGFFSDPVFFVPSKEVHGHANPYRPTAPSHLRGGLGRGSGGVIQFTFEAGTVPNGKDRWTEYRVPALELGAYLLGIIRRSQKHGLRLAASPSRLLQTPGLLWAGLAGGGSNGNQ